MTMHERAERIQTGLGLLSAILDEHDHDHLRDLVAELARLELSAEELSEARRLHHEGRDAARPLNEEIAAKRVYLALNAPGATLESAGNVLPPEQLAEFQAITSLDSIIDTLALEGYLEEAALAMGTLATADARASAARRNELVEALDAAQGLDNVTYSRFRAAFEAGADCGVLFEMRNAMKPADPLREAANSDLRSVGCYMATSTRREPDPTP